MTYKLKNRDLVFIFDVDGVIADTPQEESWLKAINNFGWDYNGNFKKFYQNNLAGSPREAGIKKVLEHFMPEEKDDETMIRIFSEEKQKEYLKLIDSGKFRVYGEIKNLILEAKKQNVTLAVCSSSENSKRLLENIQISEYGCRMADLFSSITAGAKSNGAVKKSTLYTLAFEKLKKCVSLNDPVVLVLEDADVGVEAAIEARFYCAGIARQGLTTPKLLKLHGANFAYGERQLKNLDFARVLGDLEQIVAA